MCGVWCMCGMYGVYGVYGRVCGVGVVGVVYGVRVRAWWGVARGACIGCSVRTE